MSIDPEFWHYAIPAVASGGASVFAVWLGSRRADGRSRATNAKVDQAIELAEPTGNGFAKHVMDALAEIKEAAREQAECTKRVEAKIDQHVATHATSDLMRSNK